MVRFPWSPDEEPALELPQRSRRFFWRHLPGISVSLLLALVIAILIFPYMVVTVPSGEVGVLWKRFTGPGIYCWCILARGTILDPRELREEGLHVIWPWDKLFLYDLRLQSQTEKYNAITSDGVSVTAEINIRYQLNHDSIAVFHKFIGPGYLNSLLAPEIGSQTRDVISQYTAQQVYTSRQKIEEQIRATAQNKMGSHLNQLVQPEASEQQNAESFKDALQNSIRILDTLVLSIELPEAIVAAINRQTEQLYKITEYKYRAERELEESKRKQIEANGIAAFQRTVSQGISDSYLRWHGIEATVALAQSPNAKIVVIGTGKDGLPIILGNADAPAAPAAPPKSGDDETPPGSSPSPAEKTPRTSSMVPEGMFAGAPKPSSAPGTKGKDSGGKSAASSSDGKSEPGASDSPDLSDLTSILARLSKAWSSPPSSGAGSKPNS